MPTKNQPSTPDALAGAPGVIDPRMIYYSKEEFMRRTGLRPAACREAKRNGLVVRYKHKRAFIIGEDWLSYLQSDDGKIGRE